MTDRRLRSDENGAGVALGTEAAAEAAAEVETMKTEAGKKASGQREPAGAQRGRRSGRDESESRNSRAMTDRAIGASRTLTDEQRLELFREQFIRAALPDLPPIPGYHVCWLTTNNPRDNVPMRLRLGYEPVKPEDVPGWDHATIKTGEWTGYIGVNEMLAFKLPLSLYEKYMQELHYDAPAREQEKLTAAVDALRERAAADKTEIEEGDGMRDLRKLAPRPTFLTDEERRFAGMKSL